MADWRMTAIRRGLDALYVSGAHHLLRPLAAGVGIVFMLHHVRPPREDAFQPNRLLEITPEFLSAVVKRLRASGVDIVSIDEAHRRLIEGRPGRRFAVFTFDDGYRDNLEYAYPILRRHGAPFVEYIATGFADRTTDLWWLTLERVIAASKTVALDMDGALRVFETRRTEDKYDAFRVVYWWLRTLDEPTLRRTVRDLAARYGVDTSGDAARLCMDWQEIAELARDPLVTIGAHTVTHPRLKFLSDKDARAEMARSLDIIAAALGRRPEHFAYPVGDRTSAGPREFRLAAELGMKTAVTTRRGTLFPVHRNHLTALPRVSLHGELQSLRYLELVRSGVPFALASGFRKVDAV